MAIFMQHLCLVILLWHIFYVQNNVITTLLIDRHGPTASQCYTRECELVSFLEACLELVNGSSQTDTHIFSYNWYLTIVIMFSN